ncbi:hypothetical protein ACJ72_01719, partial [Emergomyces africanus]
MSYVARRGLSTLIPPKVASPTGIGAARDAARMERIVGFYEKLPRGAAPEIKPTGLIGRYQARYFGKNPSAMPLIHAIGGLMLLGYSMDYYFHLPWPHVSPIASTSSIFSRRSPTSSRHPACFTGLYTPLHYRTAANCPFGSFGSGKEAELHTETSPASPTRVIHALTNIVPDELGGYRGDTHSLIRDSSIVMAEQSSHDVVNQTRSGGEISPSDVPANKPDNITAGGDAGGVQDNENTDNNIHSKTQPRPDTTSQESANDTSGMLETAIPETSTTLGYETNKHCDANLDHGNDKTSEINGLRENSHTGDDRLSPLQLGDASGGSDTDTSRTDLRTSADGSQHIRTSSVKRTSVFKQVSYAKFSVTKSPASLQTSKASAEKTPFSSASSTPSLSQPAKPRLVAKATGGLRDLAPKSTGIGNKNGSGGPDPNQQTAVQPPSTKHLTDEELKQQYGIHMTSRIQEDGN